MTWEQEVAEAATEVLSEFDDIEQGFFEDVEIRAVPTTGPDYYWGAFFPWERRIDIYQPAFDNMPDPENRGTQLREVIRHELWHVLGDNHPQPGHEVGI